MVQYIYQHLGGYRSMARKKKILSPTYTELIVPTYEVIKQLGNSATNEEIYNKIIENLNLPDEVIHEPHGKNLGRGELEYQLAWARTYLKNYGVIKSIKRGTWEIESSFVGNVQLNYREVIDYTAHKKQQIDNNAENINENSQNEDISEQIEDNKYISDVEQPNSADLYIKSLIDLWKTKDLRIPFFQRKFVWTLRQASLFIESLLSNLPIPALMFYKDSSEYQYIIDGQQRTKSILYFTGAMEPDDVDEDNKKFINFKLVGLADDSPYKNKTFAGLDPSIKRKLLNRTLPITTVKVNDDSDLPKIFEIFRRLNTGGTPLTKQEIRNCICAGNFNEFLIDLNKNKEWQSFITSENDRKRQRDVELILRFFALYETYKQYKRPMDEFLTLYFDAHRNIDEIEKEEKAALFNTVVSAIYKNLGRRPFHIKNGLNSGVCDSVMVAFANNINNIPLDIKDRFFALTHNGEFYKYCGKNINDNESVQCRIQIATDYLFGNTESL